MEENIGETAPVAPFAPNEAREQVSKPWLKIGLLTAGGLILAGGLVFAGYKMGQRQAYPPLPQKLTPTPFVARFPTVTPFPTTTALPTEAPVRKDLTANWKTYINSKISFSFGYPQTLTPSECKDGLHLFEVTSGLKSSEYCETPPFGKISLDYATTSFSSGYSQSLDFEVKEEQITVAGIKAIKQTIEKIKEAPGPDYAVLVIFSKDTYYFLVSLGDKEYEDTFNLMLSTFKFLD